MKYSVMVNMEKKLSNGNYESCDCLPYEFFQKIFDFLGFSPKGIKSERGFSGTYEDPEFRNVQTLENGKCKLVLTAINGSDDYCVCSIDCTEQEHLQFVKFVNNLRYESRCGDGYVINHRFVTSSWRV